MDKPQQSTDSIMNGIIKRAKAQAVKDSQAQTPLLNVTINHWSGHAFLAPTEVPRKPDADQHPT